jgi:pyruvate,orthophosphate dikinase
MTVKYVYFFGGEKTEGNAGLRNLLGEKGANLAEMVNLGIQVPPGFTISTEACDFYLKNKGKFPTKLWDEILNNLKILEEITGKKLGDKENPLLVSVRSGSRSSIPILENTVLNLGLNDEISKLLPRNSPNENFALDCYSRLIAMFGYSVLNLDRKVFESLTEKKKKKVGKTSTQNFSTDNFQTLINRFKAAIKKNSEREFPQDSLKQLKLAIEAVFNSWDSESSKNYRNIKGIPDEWGIAINVQEMVFGNLGENSGRGFAFSRNPESGEKKICGEFWPNCQAEKLIGDNQSPVPVSSLEETLPDVYSSITEVCQKLERRYQDVTSIEFTVEENRLYTLQTEAAKRTPVSAIKIAFDMVQEGLVGKQNALMRIPTDQLDMVFHPMVDMKSKPTVIAKGLGASPGAASGKVVFNPQKAQELAEKKEKAILVRTETSPEDIRGMEFAQGILTMRGGKTSHATVFAKAMGKPCVSSCSSLKIDEKKKQCRIGGVRIKELEEITLDGSSGNIFKGTIKTVQPRLSAAFTYIMKWADELRKLKVRANVDTPHDALVARDFGAQGIGLCRTERMFFQANRILYVRAMILASDQKIREEALKNLLPIQRSDFTQIFRAMDGLPVNIRLLDLPLHEFLPSKPLEIKSLAKELNIPLKALNNTIDSLKEANPMLGHRGCRLGITYPEIYQMQARAIFEAACKLVKKGGKVFPEIMIPLVGHVNEFKKARELLDQVAEEVIQKNGVKLKYKVGAMIELPRAALTADEISRDADFLSFGTNDLTQTLYGLCRDDAWSFMAEYLKKGIFQADPFSTMDRKGLGALIEIAVQKGKSSNQNIQLGVCGEHAADPDSIDFFCRLGLDYVSCSPFQVPASRLAAAQAAIGDIPPSIAIPN